MNHVLYGATIPFLIGVLIFILKRGRIGLPFLILIPLAMAAGACWAVLPDIPRMLGATGVYLRIHADPRIDLFLWHGTIDRLWDAHENSSFNAVGIALEAALLMAAALRQLFKEQH